MQVFKFCVLATCFLGLILGCAMRGPAVSTANLKSKYDVVSDSGGLGDSYETAITLMGGKDHTDAVEYEYRYIANLWGEKDKNWKIVEQTTTDDEKRKIDMVSVEVLKTGKQHFFFFDVSYYYKKKHTLK